MVTTIVDVRAREILDSRGNPTVEVDVVLPIRSGGHIRRRCMSQSSNHQAILLQRLGLNLPKNLPLTEKILKTM